MFRYAQIDILTGKCVGVSTLSSEVVAEHMKLLSDDEDVKPNDTYENGTWIPAPPPEPVVPQPDRITQLEQQLAQTNADLAAVLEMILT